MRAPQTYAVYPQHPGDAVHSIEDPADLGTAFGLDASLVGDDPESPSDDPSFIESPVAWLSRRLFHGQR